MEQPHRSERGRRAPSGRWIRTAAAALAVITLAAFAASCSSDDSSDSSKSDSSSQSKSGSKSSSGSSGSSTAQQASVAPEGAEAAVAKYVESQGHVYAGDCANATLPKDKGKWCSTLAEGDDTSNSKTYLVGPVGEKPVSKVTVTRNGQVQLTPGVEVGVANGNVGVPRELTASEIAGNTFISGNLLADQALGIGNGLADRPAGVPDTGGDGTGGPTGTPPPPPPPPPTVIVQPGAGDDQYPPDGVIVIENPNVQPGGEAVFRGGGCTGNEVLQVSFDGRPVGTITSDAQGNFAGSISIPPGTTPGAHTLTVKGAVCELNATITVGGALAFTGSSSHTMTYALGGFAAVVVGLVLVVGARRRRTTRGSRASSSS
ncbi:MAG TPA: hypothetical protein VFZ17_01865, partial [Acidimicrobiia bacterium]|nr:hypothetical protein [Acidimicrobiia bacterium]